MPCIRILLVDDHAVLREGLRSILVLEPDMEVVAEAADSEVAVRVASPHSAVVILTMHDADEFLFAAVREGAAG